MTSTIRAAAGAAAALILDAAAAAGQDTRTVSLIAADPAAWDDHRRPLRRAPSEGRNPAWNSEVAMGTKLIAAMLILLLAVPAFAQTPSDAEVWHIFATRLEVGSRVKLQLHDGRRFPATLLEAGTNELTVQPRTRRPVPVQRVPYDAIAVLERDDSRGIGVGKAVAIGAAAGVGAFFGTFLFLLAAFD
jgi:hypothetical protein